jgi:hypothetical protein
VSALNPHEFLGVISARLVHRLSNYLSVIVGNLAIHDSPQSTEADRTDSIAAIREATSRAGLLLDRFSQLTRTLPREENFCSLQQLLSLLSDWTTAHNWKLEVAPDIATKGALALAGPWKWLAFALDTIADSAPGILELTSTPSAPRAVPLRDYIPLSYITLTLIQPGPAIDWQAHRENLENFELAAAYEILQTLGARPETKSLNANQRQTRFSLPLIDAL